MEEHSPRVVDGILFVWVPACPQSELPAHWMSASGNRVRLIPGSINNVVMHELYEHQPTVGNNCQTAGHAMEDEAFKLAARWASQTR